MRQLLINELQPADVQKIDAYLSSNTQQSEMPGLFWITLPENILTEDQKNHDKCGPFLFSSSIGMRLEAECTNLASGRMGENARHGIRQNYFKEIGTSMLTQIATGPLHNIESRYF